MNKPVQVLLVEDSEDDAMLITHRIERHDEPIAVTRVDTPFALQAALDSGAWDIVISDYRLPLMSGLLTLDLVRRHSPDLPFILVSATMGEDVAVDAMRSGANDYVMKNKLARLLPAFQRELRASRSRRAHNLERNEQRTRIDRLAHYDKATGMANRVLFEERLNAFAGMGSRLGIVVVQLDRYEEIAGVVGPEAGDELIAQAAARLSTLVGDSVRIGRLSSDRFAILLAGMGEGCDAAQGLQLALRTAFARPFVLSGCDFTLDPSMGVAIHPDDSADALLVLRHAEAAAAQARASGDVFYAARMTAHVAEKLAMENRLRRALERGEFVLQYQPKVALADGSVAGVEALIRWHSPELGTVAPSRFIPVLEETGMILEVGAWVLRKAVADQRRWTRAGRIAPRVAVNVSVSQLRHPGFVALVKDAVEGTGAAPGIDLEITESLAMDDVASSIAKLAQVRELGVGVAIDDFGTGYSSLAYLARLPVNAVKIERSFIAAMLGDPGTMRLVTTMVDLAHSLRLKAIAEGVETPEQAAALRALGCDEGQGFLYGHAMDWDAMKAMLGIAAAPANARGSIVAFRAPVRRPPAGLNRGMAS